MTDAENAAPRLTDAEIEAMLVRAEAASPAPWYVCGEDRGEEHLCVCGLIWSKASDTVLLKMHTKDTEGEGDTPFDVREADSRFIVAARSDLPTLARALLAERQRAERLEAAVREALAGAKSVAWNCAYPQMYKPMAALESLLAAPALGEGTDES